MKCPYCGNLASRVLDSRATDEGAAIRRRRECMRCANRFTTMEKAEEEPIVVVKQNGRREMFDQNKILTGLVLAGQKRNIPRSVWQNLVNDLEQELRSNYTREVSTEEIGNYLLAKLRLIDEVAYVRFASVFRQFPDIKTFQKELDKLIGPNEDKPGHVTRSPSKEEDHEK